MRHPGRAKRPHNRDRSPYEGREERSTQNWPEEALQRCLDEETDLRVYS